MYIRQGYEMVFNLPYATPMVLLLNIHPSRDADLRQPDRIHTTPEVPQTEFIDGFGNRCVRIVAPPGTFRLSGDTVVEDSEQPDLVVPDAIQHNVEDLPNECLPFLLASRYCEVDKLSDIAWQLFKDAPLGWGRVQAVCDWAHNHVTFGYNFAHYTRTAFDVYGDGKGVCRDFQHLAITFCRALNIPARYATGYLGDHMVVPDPGPMDFSAWFEAYLGGRWYAFDARYNTPRVGRTLMAVGRDAADCALTTSFGSAPLEKFLVWSDPLPSAELPPR